MTLSPEQFNKLATKKDLENFVTKEEFQAGLDSKFNQVMTVLDRIVNDIQEMKNAQALNQAAHDRFNDNFVIIKNKLEIEEIVTV